MEGSKRREEVCPQLLDLISKDREWLASSREKSRQGSCSDERKLELRLGLGPPGENWSSLKDNINCRERVAGGGGGGDQDQSHLSLGYGNRTTAPWAAGCGKTTSFLHQGKNNAEKNEAFSSAPTAANTAVPNTSSQKRYSFSAFFPSLSLFFFLFLYLFSSLFGRVYSLTGSRGFAIVVVVHAFIYICMYIYI